MVAPRAAVASTGALAISPVVIAPGPDTGTSVNHTIAGLRASLQDIASRLSSTARQYAGLRGSSAQQVAAYYQAQAQISARLQIGTARGNPELVAQWNGAQAALDQLTANVNALGALATQVSGDGARTRTLLGQVQATLAMAGATDEDHRQLGVLEDEANQVAVVLDRLSRDMSADVRRGAATLNSERPRLAQLANAIKTGDLYASGASSGTAASGNATAGVSVGGGGAGQPIVTIRFARRNANYQKALYSALNQALQGQPMASFQVVGVSPTRSSAAAVQAAQSDARRRAQEVMHTMGEMGVPPARMEIAATTDPAVSGSEVRVFLR